MKRVRKIIREIITKILKEESEFEHQVDSEMPGEIMHDIANQTPIKFRVIPNTQYHTALKDFVKYGEFFRFPTKYIFRWKNLVLNNIAKLNALTEINGHSTNFPFDLFYDTFDNSESYKSKQYNLFTNDLETVTPDGEYTTWAKKRYKETGDEDYLKKYDFGAAYEFLEKVYNIDDIIPQFSNGQYVLSDFAIEPLLKLGVELEEKKTPEEIIIVINKILDVTHQRSDIAELFIRGGSDSLTDIFK